MCEALVRWAAAMVAEAEVETEIATTVELTDAAVRLETGTGIVEARLETETETEVIEEVTEIATETETEIGTVIGIEIGIEIETAIERGIEMEGNE